MTMRKMPDDFGRAIRAVRVGRLVALLLAAVAAGLASDWWRSDQRLVFSRPLPVFITTPPTR